jgi:hypothetical protein
LILIEKLGSALDNQNTAITATGMMMFGAAATFHNESFLSDAQMAYGAATFSYFAGGTGA